MFKKLGLPNPDLLKSHSFTAVNQQLINQNTDLIEEEKKLIKASNQFQLNLAVSDTEKKVIGTEDVVFFRIDLQSNISKREWSVYHRYSDFYELNTVFNKYYVNPPQLSLNLQMKFSNLKETIQYQTIFNTFLLKVISRPDLINSIYTIKFLQLENHYQDIALYQLYLLYHLKDELKLPIKCAYLYEETNLLILALGESSLSNLPLSIINPLTNVFSKISSNWSFGFKSLSSSQTHFSGQLVIYNILKDHRGLNHFEPLYTKILPSVPCSLNYFKEKNNMFIGMENGEIAIFKLYITESSSETKDLAEELNTIKIHRNPIIGVYANYNQGYVYSFSRGKHMKMSDLNTQTLIKDIPITARDVVIMKYDPRWGRVILSDDCGSLYIIDIFSNPLTPQVVSTIVNNLTNVTCFKTYFSDDFFIMGTRLGKCSFFKIRNYNQNIIKQEHMPCTTQIDIIKVKEINLKSCIAIRDVVINKKSEVFIGLANGSIAVYVHEDNNPECKLY